jgi:hypothetical protein
VWVEAAAAGGGVGLAAPDGLADGVGVTAGGGVAVAIESGVDAEGEGAGDPAAVTAGDGPAEAVVQAPRASAATMSPAASREPRTLVRVIAEV